MSYAAIRVAWINTPGGIRVDGKELFENSVMLLKKEQL